MGEGGRRFQEGGEEALLKSDGDQVAVISNQGQLQRCCRDTQQAMRAGISDAQLMRPSGACTG